MGDKHGDNTYNREVRFIANTRNYLSDDILAIKIMSDSDYDNHHPANSDLSDIVEIIYASPLQYIRSGYKDLYDYASSPLSEYEKRLLDIMEEEVHIMQKNFTK